MMDDQITKAKLLDELRAARAEWDTLLAEVGQDHMTEPGAAGDWSVKDMVAHLTSYSQRFISASEAQFRGELPPPDSTEGMDFETLNQHYYALNKDRPLSEILAESEQVFKRLLEVTELHSEEFLIQPQEFPGAPVPGPLFIWKILEGDVYGHYREHMEMIREWLGRIRNS